MTIRTHVSIGWIAAALFPAMVFALAAAAADEPEKKREERRPEKREQRRTDPQQTRQPSRSAPPEGQAAPQPRTERRATRIESRPAPGAGSTPSHVQPPGRPQERRPAPVYPATTPPVRRPDRMPPPRHVEIIRHPAGDRIVTRNSMGSRTVVVERPDRIVVSHAPGRGYVQRPVVIARTTYMQRTYVQNNVVVTRVYRPYAHRGITFAVYTPIRYYPPPFYAWTYSPWRTPVRYTWGWYGDPWYGYYRGYFAPYPVYTSPAFWLTDYLIASTLQAAYMERMAERRAAASSPYAGEALPLSPEVKQAIAAEVQQQIQYERNAAQAQAAEAPANGLPPTLSDNRQHMFLVDRGLDVPNLSMGGQMCAISEGDVLQMNGPAPADADAANVVVVSAKPGSCGRGSAVSVYLSDLSEMQNQLRHAVDQGMEELRAKQGQGGLPPLPANLASAPTAASFAAQLPPPDPNAATDLQQQYADQPAQEAPAASQVSATGVISVYGGPTPTVSAGQSIEQVIAILGQPKSIADLGSKKVYVFKELKVTFLDGRVADVQ